MQMERMRMIGNNNGNGSYDQFCNDYNINQVDYRIYDNTSKEKSPLLISASSPSSPALISSPGGGLGYIEHPVSKFDTLAGVAIKYGVEVADIKKLNGLVTDRQMFALKSLQIPLPGRHPPAPCLSNGSDPPRQNAAEQNRRHSDIFDSFQSLRLKSPQQVSPAMSTLQGYYGLKPADPKFSSEGFEMSVYKNANSHYFEDGEFLQSPPYSSLPFSSHRKSRSLANGFAEENNEEPTDNRHNAEVRQGDTKKWNEKLIRRCQKSEVDFNPNSSEMLKREDSNGGGAFSAITGKGLALRNKAASRTSMPTDAEASSLTTTPPGSGDSPMANILSLVRKSSSTSSLHDQDSSSTSIWPTSTWSLKQDLQALSAAAIARPIFDGLPKPISNWRNKTALD